MQALIYSKEAIDRAGEDKELVESYNLHAMLLKDVKRLAESAEVCH